MALLLRFTAMAVVLHAGLMIGSTVVQTAQAGVDARNAALCQVETRYCK